MEAQFLSGELLSNPHFLRGGGGCHDVQIKNHSDIRNQSRVSRRCLGYELLTENKKEKIRNLKPVWMFGYELLKVTPEL